MSRKFSIMTVINLEKLNKEIEDYVNLNYSFDPYIFMNEETAKAIEDEVGAYDIVIDNNTITSKRKKQKGDVFALYTGYKIFINNDLKFGIIEIR